MNQDGGGRIGLLDGEDVNYMFSESLRRESYRALHNPVSEVELFWLQLELTDIALYYASKDMVAFQALHLLREIRDAFPKIPQPRYDELVSKALNKAEQQPELSRALLGVVNITPFQDLY